MQRCQFCGTELPGQAGFCGNCGNMVHTLPGMQSDASGPPAIDVQSQDTPTAISDASLPTTLSKRFEQDTPTVISDPFLPTVFSDASKKQHDTPSWEWSYDQDDQNRQLPGDRQTEESKSFHIEPFLPGIPLVQNPPPAGSTPIVQGTPQVGGVPSVHGTPQVGGAPSVHGTPPMLNSPPPAASNPLTAQGFGHAAPPPAPSPSMPPSAAPPSPSVPPSASPQPQLAWRLVVTPQKPPAVIPLRRKIRPRPYSKKARTKFDETILQVLSKIKNAKLWLLLGAILLILGSAGVYALDEKLEPNSSSVGFLGFDEGIERQLAEAVSHGKAHASATAYAVVATRTATAAIGTAAALQHPFPQGEKLIYNDTLSNNSKTYTWVSGYKKVAGTDCFFVNGAYHVVESNTNHFYYCIANKTSFSNFALQVEMKFIQGNYGGILFRSLGKRHYVFRIGRDGSYVLQLYIDDSGRNSRLLAHGRSAAINKDLNQANLIGVVARGSNIDLYVNQQYLTSVQDSSYSQGQIGLEAEDHGVPAEVMFKNVKVWAV